MAQITSLWYYHAYGILHLRQVFDTVKGSARAAPFRTSQCDFVKIVLHDTWPGWDFIWQRGSTADRNFYKLNRNIGRKSRGVLLHTRPLHPKMCRFKISIWLFILNCYDNWNIMNKNKKSKSCPPSVITVQAGGYCWLACTARPNDCKWNDKKQ